MNTDMKPMTLMQDFLALSDDIAQTVILNWQIGSYAVLQHTNDGSAISQVRIILS